MNRPVSFVPSPNSHETIGNFAAPFAGASDHFAPSFARSRASVSASSSSAGGSQSSFEIFTFFATPADRNSSKDANVCFCATARAR